LKSEVNTAVRAASASFCHPIPVMPIYLGYLAFKVLPTEPVQPVDVQMLP
jgi:hypothetical protein